MVSFGEVLVRSLEAYGVDTVFGIPGVHTLELYRGLSGSTLHHVTPRHEQGAGFMAIGYARLSDRPAACFVISGPGLTNILTPMGQAYSDSVPMLVIASVIERQYLGLGAGRLHEMPSQRGAAASVAAYAHTILEPDELPQILARAFSIFSSKRPRPVYIEVPIDVLSGPADHILIYRASLPSLPAPPADVIAQAADLLCSAQRPLVILGGGSINAAFEVITLVEWLNAPVVTTIHAKGVMPPDHPLFLGSTLGYAPVRAAIEQADVVLAVGTELSETDQYPAQSGLAIKGKLVRIDIDSEQFHRLYPADIAILGDARLTLAALNEALAQAGRSIAANSPAAQRAAEIRAETRKLWDANMLVHQRLLDVLQAALPGLVITGDSTQPVYSANIVYNPGRPRSFFTSSTGFGTLGYALPAAIGAKLAAPERTVVAIIGDGGLQFTLPELASAIEAKAPVIILLWNNQGYGEIKHWMVNRGIAPIGTDLYTPDFLTVARGYGCLAHRATNLEHLQALLQQAGQQTVPMLIEIQEGDAWLAEPGTKN
jgi:acetolactate synthase-1/2/3 large subunit